jgi:hypothetical protein
VATVPQEEGVPLFVGDATVTLGNTVLVGGGNTICVGGLPTSLGGNVADDTSCGLTATGDQQGVNPLLGALANNGGPTMTHLPGAGSPAIDGGVATGCPAADQRGVARPQDGNNDSTVACDSGAVEIAGTAPTTTTTTTTTTAPTTTTTAAPTTTTAPAPTTTTTLPAVLPPTGSGSGSGFAVAALITGAGAGLIILARRRPTHPTN